MRVRIDAGVILSGALSVRARRLVLEWRALHEVELGENWRRAQQRLPLIKIPPLE